jgi:hypothetical protein
MTDVMIKIDMSKACTKCGQMGATPDGICIQCATDAIVDDGQRLIDESLISAWNQIKSLMALHTTQIRTSYLKSDDGKLSIGLTVEISPSTEVLNAIKVRVKINFIESRIRDESVERVSLQQKLPM